MKKIRGLVMMLALALSMSVAANAAVELEFYQQKQEAVGIFNKLIEKFQAENPGIKVVQNTIPGRESRTILATRMASGDVPDIFSAYPNESDFKVFVESGYTYNITGQDFLKNVNPTVLNGIKQSGKDYSLPISLNTIGVFYNTEIFSKFSIAIPKTYAEFIAAAKKLKAAGITPFAVSGRDDWTLGIIANLSTGEEMGKGNTEKFFEGLNKGTTSATKNATMKLVANRLLEITSYGPEDAAGMDYSMAINMFATGKSAMFINGIWAIPSIEKANPNAKFNMFPIPAVNAKNTKTIYGIDFAVSVSAKTKHPAEALKFLKFLAKQESAQFYSDMDNSPSVIKGVIVKSDKIKELAALIDNGKAFPWLHFKWAAGMENNWNRAAQELVFTKNVDKYLSGIDKMFLNSQK